MAKNLNELLSNIECTTDELEIANRLLCAKLRQGIYDFLVKLGGNSKLNEAASATGYCLVSSYCDTSLLYRVNKDVKGSQISDQYYNFYLVLAGLEVICSIEVAPCAVNVVVLKNTAVTPEKFYDLFDVYQLDLSIEELSKGNVAELENEFRKISEKNKKANNFWLKYSKAYLLELALRNFSDCRGAVYDLVVDYEYKDTWLEVWKKEIGRCEGIERCEEITASITFKDGTKKMVFRAYYDIYNPSDCAYEVSDLFYLIGINVIEAFLYLILRGLAEYSSSLSQNRITGTKQKYNDNRINKILEGEEFCRVALDALVSGGDMLDSWLLF